MKKYALFLQAEFSTHYSSSKLKPKPVNREIDRLSFSSANVIVNQIIS